ncbi:hypothetical protein [Lonepinella sp. BR2271]|uniref:hypothetical protein n=1 Tax=Lonepinella sp. BR2271 TaxID=3434550 RepID=UPI003F6E34D9
MRNWLKMLIVVCLGLGSCTIETPKHDDEVINAINSNNWPEVFRLKDKYFHIGKDNHPSVGTIVGSAIGELLFDKPVLRKDDFKTKAVSTEVQEQAYRYINSLDSYDKLAIKGSTFNLSELMALVYYIEIFKHDIQAAKNIIEGHVKKDPSAKDSEDFRKLLYRFGLAPEYISYSRFFNDCLAGWNIRGCQSVFKENQCHVKYIKTATICEPGKSYCDYWTGVCTHYKGQCHDTDIYDSKPTCNSPRTSPKDKNYRY